MSQSAENQSAIIENENNSNIVMESQAAMSGRDEEGGEDRGEFFAESGPLTPTQDEADGENLDEGEGVGIYEQEDGGEAELIGDSGDASQPPADGFDEEATPSIGASGDAFLDAAEEHPPQSPGENQQEAEAMEMERDQDFGQEQEPLDEPQELLDERQDLAEEEPQEETAVDQDWSESADAAREGDGVGEKDGIQQGYEAEATENFATDDVSQDLDTRLEDQDQERLEDQDQEADNQQLEEGDDYHPDGEQNDNNLATVEGGDVPMSAEDEDRLLAEESQVFLQGGNEEQQLTDDQTSQDADAMQRDEGEPEGSAPNEVDEGEEHQATEDEASQNKIANEDIHQEDYSVGMNESMDVSQDASVNDDAALEVIEDESQDAYSRTRDESNDGAGDESNAGGDMPRAEESHSGHDESSLQAGDDGAISFQDMQEDQSVTDGEATGEPKQNEDDASILEGDKPEVEESQTGDANTSEDTIDDREVLEIKDDDNVSSSNKEPVKSTEPQSDEKIIADLVADVTKQVAAEVDGASEKDKSNVVEDDDDDDVVVIGDEPPTPRVKKEAMDNDMGIQIASVSGGADHLHQQAIKQENGLDVKPVLNSVKNEPQTTSPAKKPAKAQTCIVCQKIGKCKYNIVRNGDIKHLCDDTCFKRFRTNPTMFLKGKTAQSAMGTNKPLAPKTQAVSGTASPGYKTCVVCQLMNINTQGQFCMWKGLDFCGEGCLGKFQASISTSCTLCTSIIPITARSSNCLRIGNEVRPFCSSRCYNDYKQRMRLCSFCQKDLSTTSDSFSAPMGSDGCFKDFCTQACMKKYEDMLTSDVEILRVEPGKLKVVNACSVCKKNEVAKHSVKYNNVVHHLCSDPCLSAFQYTNKLDLSSCDHCGALCTQLEASSHVVQFEGNQKRFCSDACVTKFRFVHRKVSPCSWCGTTRDNFDMIERLDAGNKYQLFCSLNCLSLYRVNLQAKSNQAVTCDQCMKFVPAQYHLTMSDASVRNFCSYNCVMTFQAQFSKPTPPTPSPPTPRHKHNTRGRGAKASQVPTGSPSFPIISNVVSLAPQGGQKVNIKNTTGVPVLVSGAGHAVKTTGVGGAVQQQIIIQPPPPKSVKNKALLCKPFTQTKATSCRPHTQTKDVQTDEVKEKPILIPVPIPIYLPTPCALYSVPAPTPIFIPLPIPVPIFIPTTRKSANGILKQIKEIREKTPADPLEAEILMMAAAVSADGKNSSESDTEDEMLPDVSRVRKRVFEDDDDANIMPLTSATEDREEDMISMALRMAEEMSGPMADLESAVEPLPVNTEPPSQVQRPPSPEMVQPETEMAALRRGRAAKRGSTPSKRGGSNSAGRPPKRPRVQPTPLEPVPLRQEPLPPPQPPADANYHLKFTYGVNAWRHWVVFKNTQIERNAKPGLRSGKLFKTDIMQCTPDELNFSLCLFVKEVRKPNGEEYSPDSIYYLCLGIQQYLFENGRIDNIFADIYYEKFTEVLTDILSKCQPKFNAAGQMVCRIEEEHLWECKQLGAHSPYVLLNTLIYFHTKYFMLKTPEDHMKLSFAHILKYWKKGGPGKGGQPTRSVSLRYYSVSTAKKDGSAPTSTTKKGSKEGIPVFEVTENQDNPLRCPVKLYEFYLSKCPESIKNRSDIFYPVPERSCVPDSPVWYSTIPIGQDVMTKMLTRILLVREIQEAHLHAQPIYV